MSHVMTPGDYTALPLVPGDHRIAYDERPDQFGPLGARTRPLVRQSGHVIRLTQFFERRGQLFQPGAPLGYRPPALNLPIRAGEQCREPLVERPGVAAFGARLVTGDHLPFAPKCRQGVFQQLASVVGLVEGPVHESEGPNLMEAIFILMV